MPKQMNYTPYLCPVCEKHTFKENDCFEICPVCGWEDDGLQRKYPDYPEGANGMSLNERRKRWAELNKTK